MADKTKQVHSPSPAEEILDRAIQYFSTEKFRVTSQAQRTVTFEGRPPFPWGMILLTLLGFAFCIVPGIVMYALVVKKMYRFYSLVVSANAAENGTTAVFISYPDFAEGLVSTFLRALPQVASESDSDSGTTAPRLDA
jgi:hypothetical protein